MIDIDDMKRRHQYRFFKDDIPDKEIIEKIIKDALKLTPIKNNTWYFYIDIYGPEYAEEKKKFCLQTACHIPEKNYDYIYYQYSQGMPREKHIQEDLLPILDEYYKTAERSPGLPAFNTQVLAPYLIAFKIKKSHYEYHSIMVNMIAAGEGEVVAEDEDIKSMNAVWPGASMFAYVMSVLANKEGLDASFCQCFWRSNYNYNSIYNNETDEVLFFLCIGYGDKEKSEKHISSKDRANNIVNMKDVIKWM